MTTKALKAALLDLLASRLPGKTICPSEVARLAFPDDWRMHMDGVHALAKQMAREEKVVLLSKGQPVSPDKIRGPYRVGRP